MNSYICHDGRELRHINTKIKNRMVIHKRMKRRGRSDCGGEHKPKCLYKYNPDKDVDKNKVMKITKAGRTFERNHMLTYRVKKASKR